MGGSQHPRLRTHRTSVRPTSVPVSALKARPLSRNGGDGAAVPPLLNALETKFLYVLCLRTAKCNPDDVPSDIRPFLSKAIQTHELMVHSNLAAQDVKRLDDFLAHVCRGSNMNDNPRGRSRLDRCAKEAHGRILRMGVATMLQLHDADANLFKGESLFTRQERQAHAILAYRQIVEALDSVERVAQMTRAVVLCIMQGTWGVGVAVDVRTCTPPSDGPVVAPCSVVAPRLGALVVISLALLLLTTAVHRYLALGPLAAATAARQCGYQRGELHIHVVEEHRVVANSWLRRGAALERR